MCAVGRLIERESARLGLAVEGKMTFHHDGRVIGRNGEWSHSVHVEMMERECEVSTQAQLELGLLRLLFELGEMIPQELQRAREPYSMADKAGNIDGTLHLALLWTGRCRESWRIV